MNISKIISLIQKELKESDVTEKEKDYQSSTESLVSPFKAKKTKKDDKTLNDKKNNSKNKESELDNEEVEEADPTDVFTQQLSKSKEEKSDSDNVDDDDNMEDDSKSNIERKKSKELNLSKAKSYENFINLINNFRAAGSVNGNEHVKSYFSKLTLGEKQTFITLIDGLTKACNGDKTNDYEVPRSPMQLGIKVEPKLSTDQEQRKTIKAAANGSKEAEKKMSTLQPITVGESRKINNYSIDKLLKEVK